MLTDHSVYSKHGSCLYLILRNDSGHSFMKIVYRKLLDATMESMNEKGYHNTAIQMIANKLRVSKSTIKSFQKQGRNTTALLEDFVPSVVSLRVSRTKPRDLRKGAKGSNDYG